MWKRILLVTLGLTFSLTALAQNNELEIRLVNYNELKINPGSSFCVAILLKNYSHQAKEIHLNSTTPKGWNQLMDHLSVMVPGNSKKIIILSFFAPGSAFVGDYKITISAFRSENNEQFGKVTVPIYINPRYSIETQIIKAPVYVFSGDTTSVKFLLKNTSNIRATFKTTIVNNSVSETRNITLSPNTSQILSIFISTNKHLLKTTSASVSMSAAVLGALKINSNQTCNYKILPSKDVKFDAFNRIPVNISALFATNNPAGERSYGYMFDIKGGGLITPGKSKSIHFHFRGPNRQGYPVLGQTDLYNIQFETSNTKITAGDYNFGLTPLTEGSRSGRGLRLEHNFKKIFVGSFVNFPRFYPHVKRVISFYGGYAKDKKFLLKAGYLNKFFANNSAAQLLTLSGGIIPFKGSKVKFEFATGMENGKTTKAYSGSIKMKIKTLHFFVDYTKADPDFSGYMSNTEYASSNLGFALFHKINIDFFYHFNHSNLALDTLYANAPYSNSMGASLGYHLSIKSSITFSVEQRTSKDMSEKKLFDYTQKAVRMSLSTRIKRVDVGINMSLTKTTNFLEPKEGELANKTNLNSNLNIRYRINNHISFTAFGRYLGSQQFINKNFKAYYYGTTINTQWAKELKISFQFQNNYTVEEAYKNRSLLGLTAEYRIGKKDALGAFVNYGLRKNQINNTQLSANVRFTHTLNVPSSKRKDIGSIHGKIINNGVKNIQGIMITMTGNVVYTDKNGEFLFNNVQTGTHYLFIEYSQAGYNAITSQPGPFKINIVPGKVTEFEISLTKACQIKGMVSIKKNKDIDKRKYLAVKNALKPLIVEVKKDNEMYRKYTQQDGTFVFTDLRPGLWHIKVYKNNIPEGYELETSEFSTELSKGETKSIQVQIKKIYHKIQFQQPNW